MIRLQMAIMSHLSDAQALLSNPELANLEINFAKWLLLKLDNGIKEMSSEELNEEWIKCKNQFGG